MEFLVEMLCLFGDLLGLTLIEGGSAKEVFLRVLCLLLGLAAIGLAGAALVWLFTP